MQGRRRPDNYDLEPGFTWDSVAPGDYWWMAWAGEWHVMAPSGEHGGLTAALWTLTVEADGTLTVDPSIWCNKPRGWHGYLKHGVWQPV